MKSVMSHEFSQIPKVSIQRSVFNRSHGYKTTMFSGDLVPFYCDEALPGDTFQCRATLFGRLATPIVPVMDNIFLETFYFFVPNRLLWTHWQNFNGQKDDIDDTTTYAVPYVDTPTGGWKVHSLGDYFGIPILTDMEGTNPAAFHFRAYNRIYRDWFMDENLVHTPPIDVGDGPDLWEHYVVLKRGKRHDYFTSSLPWPQKGDAVTIPMTGTAPVYGDGHALALYDAVSSRYGGLTMKDSSGDMMVTAAALNQTLGTAASADTGLWGSNYALGVPGNTFTGFTGLAANLADATSVTINSLREAIQLQRMHERDARGGTRYTEIIRSHFGVVSPDARLQRAEYLGGSSTRININPVQQTSSTDSITPQGNLAAFGLATDSKGGFSKSFTEHGVIIGIVNIRCDLTYQYGLDRMWSRRTRYDYYWPALSHLGEQEVYQKEIWASGIEGGDLTVFGYQERYAEYRYMPSKITGQFRSNSKDSLGHSNTLHFWHLSQEFTLPPVLNSDFILENPPIKRIIAVPGTDADPEPEFLLDVYMDLKTARPMPVYSVPGYMDHF